MNGWMKEGSKEAREEGRAVRRLRHAKERACPARFKVLVDAGMVPAIEE